MHRQLKPSIWISQAWRIRKLELWLHQFLLVYKAFPQVVKTIWGGGDSADVFGAVPVSIALSMALLSSALWVFQVPNLLRVVEGVGWRHSLFVAAFPKPISAPEAWNETGPNRQFCLVQERGVLLLLQVNSPNGDCVHLLVGIAGASNVAV